MCNHKSGRLGTFDRSAIGDTIGLIPLKLFLPAVSFVKTNITQLLMLRYSFEGPYFTCNSVV